MRPGHPEVEVELGWEGGVLSCAAKQTQSSQDNVPNVFEVPIVLAIVEADGSERREKLKLTSRAETFAVPVKARPRFVVVDPEMRILGEVTVRGPADMLRRQLAEAPSARGRWLAAQALAKGDDPVTISALGERLRNESEIWCVRAECAAALGHIRARECFEELRRAIDVAHPKVRRAVVDALGRFRTTAAVELLKPKVLRDASYLVEAEAARALGATRQAAAYDVLLDVVDRPSWADVLSAAAIDGFAALRDERALPHLYARTRYGHPSRVRRAAAVALPKITADRRAREHLEDMLDDVDPIVRMDVVRALADLADPRSRGALRARAEIDLDPRVRRRIREVVRDLGGEKQKAKHFEDEITKLEQAHAELKTRVSKLEAKVAPAKTTPPTKAGKPPVAPTKKPAKRKKR